MVAKIIKVVFDFQTSEEVTVEYVKGLAIVEKFSRFLRIEDFEMGIIFDCSKYSK